MPADPSPFGSYVPQLPRLIADCTQGLDAAGIVHGFGGALALAYATGAPRATMDIDINIAAPTYRAGDVLRALPDGTQWAPRHLTDIERDGQTRVLWTNPDNPDSGGFPIDLFFPQHRFHDVVASRMFRVEWGPITIPVISHEDILIFKVMYDRAKDWADLEAALANDAINWAEVTRWVTALLGDDSIPAQCLARLLSANSKGRAVVTGSPWAKE